MATLRDTATQNSPLPPSVEKAYHQKCIDLKRRLNEVEAANDAARVRTLRLERAVKKLRIERALLLEHLAKAQDLDYNESESDLSAPPTPRDRPVVVTKRRRSPLFPDHPAAASLPSPPLAAPPHQHPTHPTPSSTRPHYRGGSDEASHAAQTVRNPANLPRTIPPSEIPTHVEVPQIWYLPIGTNVALKPGTHLPKQQPWTIRDLEPRHHVYPNFDALPRREQHKLVYTHGYLPYDIFGVAVLLKEDLASGRFRQVFMGDPEWVSPVRNDVRTDAPKAYGQGGAWGLGGAPPPPAQAQVQAQTQTLPPQQERGVPQPQPVTVKEDEGEERKAGVADVLPGSPNGITNGGGGGVGGFTAANR